INGATIVAQQESFNWVLLNKMGIAFNSHSYSGVFNHPDSMTSDLGYISSISNERGELYTYVIGDKIFIKDGSGFNTYSYVNDTVFGHCMIYANWDYSKTFVFFSSGHPNYPQNKFGYYIINRIGTSRFVLDTMQKFVRIRTHNTYTKGFDIFRTNNNETFLLIGCEENGLLSKLTALPINNSGPDTTAFKDVCKSNLFLNPTSIIKVSNLNQRIAIATNGAAPSSTIHFLDFRPDLLSAHVIFLNTSLSFFNFHTRVQDMEFSPNDSIFYATTINTISASNLCQFKIQSALSGNINLSNSNRFALRPHSAYRSIELANDGKIYVGFLPHVHVFYTQKFYSDSGYIGTISIPDSFGLSSLYEDTTIKTNPFTMQSFGILPEFPSFYKNIPVHNISAAPRCVNSPTRIAHRDTLRTDSIRWNFGDPASGALNSASGNVVYHTYAQSGTYLLTAFLFKGTFTDTQRLSLRIDTLASPFLGNDTALCAGVSMVLRDRNRFPGLPLWSDSSFYDSLPVHRPGTYWYALDNGCGRFYDTLHIDSLLPPSLSLGNDTALCRDTLTLNATWPLSTYFWNTGATDSIIRTAQSGQYRVTVSNPCGVDSGAQRITFFDSLHFSLGSDTAMCIGDRFALLANVPGAQGFLWFNGNTSASALINTPGQYWLRAVNLCGAFTDTLRVDTLHPPRVELGPDTILCKNGLLLLNATQSSPAQYNWHNGSKDPYTFVYDSGRFWVVVNNACGMHSDSI
ncbi:MAG: hypothetical protein KDC37_07715, partial [Flavobacteriales bacterium]|nr:hypothetical protein [Flavobacteriales bacterium]